MATPTIITDIRYYISARAKFNFIPKGNYIQNVIVNLPANCKIYFEPGSTITWNLSEKTSCLNFTDNINFEASGCTFKMVWDKNVPYPDVDDIGPHILRLHGARNVSIKGGTYLGARGDGCFLGWHTSLYYPCENVLIEDIVCDGSRRQGMSVVSAKNLTVDSVMLKNTAGAAPQSGLDIEPEWGCEITNLNFINCHSDNNASHAYFCNFKNLNGTSKPVSVNFSGCTATNIFDADAIAVVEFSPRERNNPPKGFINFNNAFKWENI